VSGRVLALGMLLAALVLLGATTADWAVVDADRSVEAGGTGVVLQRTESTAGTAVAGHLMGVGLAALLLALPAARWPAVGAGHVLLGGVAVAGAASALGRLEGVTAAPAVALLAGAALAATGARAVAAARRRDRTGPPDATGTDPARTGSPSRYTVEAVRGQVAPDPDDEWDIAVADEDGP
jgi:hypothetical protein